MMANDQFAAMSASVVARLGEPVTYTDAGAVAHAINAIIAEQFDSYGNAVGNGRRAITVVRADAPHIARGETIATADGTVYTVEDILDEDGFITEVSASA